MNVSIQRFISGLEFEKAFDPKMLLVWTVSGMRRELYPYPGRCSDIGTRVRWSSDKEALEIEMTIECNRRRS